MFNLFVKNRKGHKTVSPATLFSTRPK